jgi:TolB-like protein/DNA-binding winged helix-turn-helix (wHTH) protein/Tfp pilus assembly protein PilF
MNRASGDSTSNSLPPRTAPVQFATFTLDLDGCSLSTADGSEVALTHSEFVALREFVCHPGRVLSRDYLLDALVGKRAGPFDRGVDVLVGRLRRKIEADPKRPRLIVTVPGEGYRFDGLTKTLSGKPSIAVPASPDDERLAPRGARPESPPLSVSPPAATEPRPLARLSTRLGVGRQHIAWIRAAGLLLIVVASGGAWYVAGGLKSAATVAQQSAALPNLAEPAKRLRHLSIVVLPFANLSGDATQDYFADGITENLTTDLSRLRGSFVIARDTAFTFTGKNVDAREIGRELGVRYILEGSVQRDQSQVRVNVQLIDAETGGHLWAGRFDGRFVALFQMQDQIVAGLGGQLGAELIADEAQRARRASNPDSMDLYFQGQAWFNKGLNRENLAQARSFFERAVALDPDNLSALLAKLNSDLIFASHHTVDDRAQRHAAIEARLIKLLAQAPNNATVHYLMGALLIKTNRGAEGIAECERALALNPNLANAHAQIGFAWLLNGRPEETESHIREAIEVSPRDTNMYIWTSFIASAKLYLGADEEAATWLRRTLELNRSYAVAHFFLSATLELLGQHDDARAEVQAALALDPQFTLRRFRAGAQSDNPIFLKQRERIIQAMQKAGIPEG